MASLHETSASITILTTLDQRRPVVLTYREQSNTQWDWVDFVIYCCQSGHLNSGDYLIVDNAAVHGGAASWRCLMDTLNAYNVTLRYLPAYSPELNPCELVFNQVKRCIKSHRQLGTQILRILPLVL